MTCPRLTLVLPVLLTACMSLADRGMASPPGAVTIRGDFSGGNILVDQNDGDSVQLAPDLRGDNPWFYWYFEAAVTRPGRVKFVFPAKVAGFVNGAIGFQGPAISKDLGKTWAWMGTGTVEENAFYYDFEKQGDKVRFAVTIPYLQAEFDDFLARNAGKPHLRRTVLTKSRKGRAVELLQVGEPGAGIQPVLMTARHHAAETIASYVLEGFVQEAMSDSAVGSHFRKKYVLFAVPFVDKDGVEDGDQGKNRKPHDHNRDYGEKSIYPEVQAIRELDKRLDFKFAVDFHCPTLLMDSHQVIYFVGAKQHPQYNLQNVTEFARGIKAGLPKNAPGGPLVWLRDEDDTSPKNSRYFGFKEGAVMSATIEIPFAPPGKATDAASCRKYGAILLQAWTDTNFRAPDAK